MRFLLTLTFVADSTGLRTRIGIDRSMSTVAMPYSLESAQLIPVPSSDDVFSRYCHIDPRTTTRLRLRMPSLIEYGGEEDEPTVSRETQLYGRCDEDSDCHSHRPFCYDNICRQCREGSEFEDCGTSAAVCSEATQYMCSECDSDEHCRSSTYCRAVFDGLAMLTGHRLPRHNCVACDSVPPFGEVVDKKICSWRCPIDTFFQPRSEDVDEDSCVECPKCHNGQFYAPRSDPESRFYSQCTNATDVVCTDCAAIGIDASKPDFCATILTPSNLHLDDLSVGDLGAAHPCRFFQCKDLWFLDASVNKCKKCHLTMCPPGQLLDGCAGSAPGRCTACKGRLPRGAAWIDPTDEAYGIRVPGDACRFTCSRATVYSEDENACVRCDPGRPKDDDLGCHDDRVYSLPDE